MSEQPQSPETREGIEIPQYTQETLAKLAVATDNSKARLREKLEGVPIGKTYHFPHSGGVAPTPDKRSSYPAIQIPRQYEPPGRELQHPATKGNSPKQDVDSYSEIVRQGIADDQFITSDGGKQRLEAALVLSKILPATTTIFTDNSRPSTHSMTRADFATAARENPEKHSYGEVYANYFKSLQDIYDELVGRKTPADTEILPDDEGIRKASITEAIRIIPELSQKLQEGKYSEDNPLTFIVSTSRFHLDRVKAIWTLLLHYNDPERLQQEIQKLFGEQVEINPNAGYNLLRNTTCNVNLLKEQDRQNNLDINTDFVDFTNPNGTLLPAIEDLAKAQKEGAFKIVFTSSEDIISTVNPEHPLEFADRPTKLADLGGLQRYFINKAKQEGYLPGMIPARALSIAQEAWDKAYTKSLEGEKNGLQDLLAGKYNENRLEEAGQRLWFNNIHAVSTSSN